MWSELNAWFARPSKCKGAEVLMSKKRWSVFPGFRVLWAWIFFSGASALAAPPSHLKVSLVSEEPTLIAGQESWVGLHFQLDPKWHIYWVNPGDSGLAPKIEWKLPPGYSAGPISWPIPQRITLGPLVNYGYEDEVLLMMPLKTTPEVAEGGKDGEVTLEGTAKWLVCSDICIPGEAPVSLKVPVQARGGHAPDPANEPLFATFRERLPKVQPAEWKPQMAAEGDSLVLSLSQAPPSSSSGDAIFFPSTPNKSRTAPARGETRRGNSHPSHEKVRRAEYDAGEISRCARLRSLQRLRRRSPVRVARSGGAGSGERGILGVIIFAFLGGIILNLMPCVFPVLFNQGPELSQWIAGREIPDARPWLGLHLGHSGLLFWSLVAVLLILRAGGEQFGWGFQLQSPGFLAFLSVVLFLFGLSLAGVFEVGSSFVGVGGGLASKGGYTGSFFTGVLATVVATPCSAPFMGSAVGFALSQSAPIAFLIFTSLALGLALPYVVLSYNPGLARFLPRPGRWMETLKQFMSFLVFATVIWLIWVFGLQAGISAVARLLTALLLVAVAGWMLGRWQGKAMYTWTALAVIVGACALGLTGPRSPSGAAAPESGGMAWEKFSPEKVQEALAAGKPVFVDFTACGV